MWGENNFYLVGIKGVAMTALAQCLVDMGKKVRGADVAEDFVTKKMLEKLGGVEIDEGFAHKLPEEVEVVIYSGAHNGRKNYLVKQALERKLVVLNHAQALARMLNEGKKGVAVCGANGKSTVSAMLAFCLEKLGASANFAVGVGEIMGMERTGRWTGEKNWFIAEADEYVEDSTQFCRENMHDNKDNFPARMMTLLPKIIVANNLSWDHPDVYESLAETKQVFFNFFVKNLLPEGKLVMNVDDASLVEMENEIRRARPDIEIVPFGMGIGGEIKLKIVGEHNQMNARAARVTLMAIEEWTEEQIECALGEFDSTKRRLEYWGEVNGVTYIDDYAHHSDEITAAIGAVQEWMAEKLARGGRLVVAFQSHTYTRTLEFRRELVESLVLADLVVMTDIFPSAREDAGLAEKISSDDLCDDLNQRRGSANYAQNVHKNEELALYCEHNLSENDVLLCLGAGDIYHFWDYLKK